MSSITSITDAISFTTRDLIEAVVSQFFILDYGFVDKVNTDGTVNVTHAVKQLSLLGESLNEMTTENIDVFTFSTAEISVSYKVSQGDKVLLLGLKDVVENIADLTQAAEQTNRVHYSRETLKALPLCAFNSDAKVQVLIDSGKLTVNTNDVMNLDGSDNGGVVIGPELKTQLGYLTARVDAIIDALENSAVAAQDGGQTYKTNITATLNLITNKEDFSNIESDKVFHGKGAANGS